MGEYISAWESVFLILQEFEKKINFHEKQMLSSTYTFVYK